ncbi:MAG TPA: DUF2130 domain-containing protein [Chitinophagaceae bacterium]|nr:DUF2130 domain-containing protein [Chitinophagaceae bacterium]
MSSQVTCPSCKTVFTLEDILTEDLEKAIRADYEKRNQEMAANFNLQTQELQQKMLEFEEKKKRENQLFTEKLQQELQKMSKQKEEEILQKFTAEHKTKIDFLEQQQKENTAKIKQLNEKELEVMQLKQLLDHQKEQESFNLKKQRMELEAEIKEVLTQEILGKERDKFDLEKRELEKQLNDQKKLTEQMSRKLEQGSMQTQGEVQELALEEILKQAFPFDVISEVGKGKRGADCILEIRNELGQTCGKIIFESKRTKEFNKDWLSKLKEDAMEASCDIPVLVTQVMPDDLKMFDNREGVWVCKLNEVIQLVKVIREGIVRVYRAAKSQENKGEKKEMLYNYFTGNEFMQQMQAVNEAYLYLKSSIDRERFQMEKLWKEREKQLDKVLLNNNHLVGSIRGIAGSDFDEMNLLE